MGGKKPLRRPLWPPTRATASNYYPLGLDGAGGAAKPLLRAPKKPAPLHGRLPAFSGAVDAFERARKCFLEWRYFFSIILSEFLKNRVALHFCISSSNLMASLLHYYKSPIHIALIRRFGFSLGLVLINVRWLHIFSHNSGKLVHRELCYGDHRRTLGVYRIFAQCCL